MVRESSGVLSHRLNTLLRQQRGKPGYDSSMALARNSERELSQTPFHVAVILGEMIIRPSKHFRLETCDLAHLFCNGRKRLQWQTPPCEARRGRRGGMNLHPRDLHASLL